jgi:hypothetical protein
MQELDGYQVLCADALMARMHLLVGRQRCILWSFSENRLMCGI